MEGIGGLPGHACRYDDTQRVVFADAVICAGPSKLLAERTPTLLLCVCATRVTGDGCSVQHANALLLCCIAQRPDIEAETRVVVRGQDADELILCYICASRISTSVAASSSSSSRGYRYVYVHVVTQIHVVRRGCCGVVISQHPRVDNICSSASQPAQLAQRSLDTRQDQTRRDMGGMASRHRGCPGEYSRVERLAQDGHDNT